MTTSAQQRLNMVESQIRPSDVTDRRILRAMLELPREQFVPAGLAQLAYMDDAVPLFPPVNSRAHGARRHMMAPRTLAKLVQLAMIDAGDKVLVIGAGRGYGAALIQQMATAVVALECDVELAAAAKVALSAYGDVTVIVGPLPHGSPDNGPYDAIVVEGAIVNQPTQLLSQLKTGGRLVAVSLTAGVGQATVWRRLGDHLGQTAAFDATVGVLPGFEGTPAFVF